MQPIEFYSINIKEEPPKFPPPLSVTEASSGPNKDLLVYVESEDSNEYFSMPSDLEEQKRTMPVEMQDFYILFGTSGLDGLRDAIEKMDEENGNLFDVFSTSPTMEIFEKCRKEIEEQAEKACEEIEKTASKIALTKLDNSINEMLDESVRYLSGIRNPNDAKYLLEKEPNVWELKPESGNGLIKALVELRNLRNRFENGAQKWLKLKNSTGDVPLSDLEKAEKNTQEALQRVMERTAAYCLKYPIIHRLQNYPYLPIYPEGTQHFLTVPASQAKNLIAFKSELLNILSSSYQDAKELRKDIAGDSSMIWKFRPLIEETLEELNQDETSFASRAAEEKMDENDLKDWIDNAEMLAIGAQTVALIASPAPPVTLTISVAATVLGLVSVGLDGYEKYQQKKAANAVLDPTLSLIGEPDWGYFLFDVATEVLGSFSKVPMSVIAGLMAGRTVLALQE